MKKIIRNKKLYIALAMLAMVAQARAEAPIDLAATGTEMAGYVSVAAGAGLAVFAAIAGVRIILKAFRTTAK
jgi:hypothetical protein